MVILLVLLRWTPEGPRAQITQLSLLAIWTGILLRQRAKTYFSVTTSLLLMLSVAGFSDNLIFDVSQPSNRDPKFVIHGLFCLAWMIALAAQADLIRTGRLGWHKRIGAAGFLSAIGFGISTFYVYYVIWVPWSEMLNRARINRILLPSFLVLTVLGWIYRHRPQWHKRMILIGTLYLMQPIISRFCSGLPQPTYVLWNGLFASLFIYDWRTTRAIHPATYLGTAWFYIAWGIVKVT